MHVIQNVKADIHAEHVQFQLVLSSLIFCFCSTSPHSLYSRVVAVGWPMGFVIRRFTERDLLTVTDQHHQAAARGYKSAHPCPGFETSLCLLV